MKATMAFSSTQAEFAELTTVDGIRVLGSRPFLNITSIVEVGDLLQRLEVSVVAVSGGDPHVPQGRNLELAVLGRVSDGGSQPEIGGRGAAGQAGYAEALV
jgi:hypothetical protein